MAAPPAAATMRVVRRPWLTFALLAAVVAVGLVVGSPWHVVDEALIRRFGFAPIDLRHGDWHRLATSIIVTSAPGPFWKTLFLVSLGCGVYERRHGAWRVALGFLAFHVGVLVVSALALLPFVHAGQQWAIDADGGYDVGPSDGAYGCLGLALPDFERNWRVAIAVGYLLVTAANLASHLSKLDGDALAGDVGHALAVGGGLAAAAWTRRRRGVGRSA